MGWNYLFFLQCAHACACARICTYVCTYVRIHARTCACMHAWQPILCESCNFKRFFYFLFPSFPSSSDHHIGSPEHSPCLLRRVFHQSSLLCPLLILSSIALECNKFYVKLSNDVLTFIVSLIFEVYDVSVANFLKFLLFLDIVVIPKISTCGWCFHTQ